MNTILLFAIAMFGVLSSCSGHYYRRRTYFRPVVHKRGVIPHRVFIHRYPTYMIQKKSMGTVYPTNGHGPFYRPNFPASINTFHPQATVNPNVVIPSNGRVVNPGFVAPNTGRFINPVNGGFLNPVNGGFVNTGFVVPREGGVIPGGVSVVGTPDVTSVVPTFTNLGINSMSELPPMDFNKNVIIDGIDTFPGDSFLFPGAGIGFQTKDVGADGKPVVQEQNKNGDQAATPDSSSLGVTSGIDAGFPAISPVVITDTSNGAELPVITPVVITDATDSTGLPDMTFPEVGLPDTNEIFPGVGGGKQNSSCHKTGCDTGAECVFAEEYICPSYIPSVACECRLGCRLDYNFIPLGGSITIDVCGNTCSCNNMYGAAECTQRMCKPEEPALSIAGTIPSDNDLGGFQGAFDSITEFPTAKTDSGFDLPPSASSRVTVPELQLFSEPMQVVEKLVNDSPVPSVNDGSAAETPVVGDTLNNVIGISNTDNTVSPQELSTESPVV
ncbi:uncharacterized protein LOC110449887 [Mizuhopecten yessoensis]|uniref:EGF-like domain-containing protein n=1 Tax=Mizuhopecten yessoensis TaxID=6573 RepID=A0A210QQ76_MIZYE|nr:uncharacterized protein LOC110449887 [Mizuhopecten yessoensis]OWF50896.1 hypothetical protein KP79_PYT00799 [Mizuhopecten yessoensis]